MTLWYGNVFRAQRLPRLCLLPSHAPSLWQIYNSMDVELPPRYICERQREINRRNKHDLPMDLSYEQVKELLDPFYSTYECSDGRMFYLVVSSCSLEAWASTRPLKNNAS